MFFFGISSRGTNTYECLCRSANVRRSVNVCLYQFIYIYVLLFKTVWLRTSDDILCYCIIPVMPLVSDWLVSQYILLSASFFLLIDRTELQTKRSNSALI